MQPIDHVSTFLLCFAVVKLLWSTTQVTVTCNSPSVLRLSGDVDPVLGTVLSPQLFLSMPISTEVLHHGRLGVDVGAFVSSPTSKVWWTRDPETNVIAVEANSVSCALLSAFSDSRAPGVCGRAFRDCAGSISWEHLRLQKQHISVVCASVSAGPLGDVVYFRTGAINRTDMGSVLDFRKKTVRKKRLLLSRNLWAPTVPLRSVLRAMCGRDDEGKWDTLKVDAQGADALVLSTALADDLRAQWLSKFDCVVGEFDNRAYSPYSYTQNFSANSAATAELRRKVVQQSPRAILRQNGFSIVDGRLSIGARMRRTLSQTNPDEWEKLFHCTASDENFRDEALLRTVLRQ